MYRLQKKYKENVIPAMKKKFGYRNDLAVPKIEKVSINVGTGRALSDAKIFEEIINDLTLITGQKPVKQKAKKSISSFKIREGMIVGVMVTLRGQRMYEFVDRLVSIVLPRVRDFRGLEKKSFDGKGNFNIGVKEHIVFPEINQENIKNIFGLEISITTTAKTDEEGEELLRLFGFPIKE